MKLRVSLLSALLVGSFVLSVGQAHAWHRSSGLPVICSDWGWTFPGLAWGDKPLHACMIWYDPVWGGTRTTSRTSMKVRNSYSTQTSVPSTYYNTTWYSNQSTPWWSSTSYGYADPWGSASYNTSDPWWSSTSGTSYGGSTYGTYGSTWWK